VQHVENNNLKIETPIGDLLFSVNTLGGNVKNSAITIYEFSPTLPEGMTVEGCYCAVLRCSSPTDLKSISFKCNWTTFDGKGYSSSGEALAAWEWEDNQIMVMVGTEDEEWLSQRLSEQDVENYLVEMNANCMSININNFPKNTELSLHFVIAWNSLPEKTDASCWFAVDVPHERVLEICAKNS
jgi:hypothetical protein